jgi:hypothetical protein
MLLLSKLGLSFANLFIRPPLKDIKNLASRCEGPGGFENTPVTLKLVSPFVLLLIHTILFIADPYQKVSVLFLR